MNRLEYHHLDQYSLCTAFLLGNEGQLVLFRMKSFSLLQLQVSLCPKLGYNQEILNRGNAYNSFSFPKRSRNSQFLTVFSNLPIHLRQFPIDITN